MFLSGGLRYDEDLLRITRHFFEAGKPVASVCHGVEIAAAAGCRKGRRATTVAKCALDITRFGGEYSGEPLVVDDNFISVRTWHDYSLLLKTLIEQLKKGIGVYTG